MIRQALAAGLAGFSAAVVLACLLPSALPGVDQAATLLPLAAATAVVALALDGRSGASVLAILAMIAAGLIVGHEVAPQPESKTGPTMVLVTHNVARANRDPAGTAAALAASGADVLLLQETDGTFAPYLASLRRRYPYGNACRRSCSLAILSRWPLTRVRWRFHDADGQAFGPGLLATTVALPWGATAPLATVHLSRSPEAAERAARRDALSMAVQRAGPAALVLGGDFNLSPWGAAMRRLERGMAPARRVTRAIFTFPAQAWLPLPVAPIDHVFAGSDWRVIAAERLSATGSDHYPVRVILLWRAPGL